jgi:hypothetical protein
MTTNTGKLFVSLLILLSAGLPAARADEYCECPWADTCAQPNAAANMVIVDRYAYNNAPVTAKARMDLFAIRAMLRFPRDSMRPPTAV